MVSLESRTGITMATATLRCLSASIRSIASMAKEKSNYLSFYLPPPFRSWVITLGIRKHLDHIDDPEEKNACFIELQH